MLLKRVDVLRLVMISFSILKNHYGSQMPNRFPISLAFVRVQITLDPRRIGSHR